MNELCVSAWPIDKVIPFARNARKIPASAVDKVAASIKELGYTDQPRPTRSYALHSQATLAKVSTDWPMSRFVEIWNGIPGQTPVKKFQDRKKAVARVWSAIQPLAGNGQPSESAAEKPDAVRTAGKPAEALRTLCKSYSGKPILFDNPVEH